MLILFDRRVKLFIFARYTGLGYAELKKLKGTRINQGNNRGKCIIIHQAKTDFRCRGPLLPQAIVILQEYVFISNDTEALKVLL